MSVCVTRVYTVGIGEINCCQTGKQSNAVRLFFRRFFCKYFLAPTLLALRQSSAAGTPGDREIISVRRELPLYTGPVPSYTPGARRLKPISRRDPAARGSITRRDRD